MSFRHFIRNPSRKTTATCCGRDIDPMILTIKPPPSRVKRIDDAESRKFLIFPTGNFSYTRARARAQPRRRIIAEGTAQHGVSRDVTGCAVTLIEVCMLAYGSRTQTERACLLATHGLPHVAPGRKGRKSARRARAIRTDGISPLGSALGQLRDRQRTSRAAGARPELPATESVHSQSVSQSRDSASS